MVFSSLTKVLKGRLKSTAKTGMRIGKVQLKKTYRTGKAVAKKHYRVGKKIGITAVKRGGKAAINYGNQALNTAIRGLGAAASATAGNPAPYLAAEGIILGKNHLVKTAPKKFMKKLGSITKGKGTPIPTTSKSNVYYPQLTSKMSGRNNYGAGTAIKHHGYDSFALSNTARVNTARVSNRNLDHYSSHTRPTGAKI